jgi:uncharacterized membrane protein YbhN (UPF0104 family)
MKTLFLFIFALCLLAISPFLSILSVNILFNTNIPYNPKTLFAAFWLTGLFIYKGNNNNSKK